MRQTLSLSRASRLIPRPFLGGRVRKGRGRKGLVNNLTATRIHGISIIDSCEATNTYKFTLHTLNVMPHVQLPFTQNVIHDSHLLEIRIFPHQRWWYEEYSRESALGSSYSPDPSFLSSSQKVSEPKYQAAGDKVGSVLSQITTEFTQWVSSNVSALESHCKFSRLSHPANRRILKLVARVCWICAWSNEKD